MGTCGIISLVLGNPYSPDLIHDNTSQGFLLFSYNSFSKKRGKTKIPQALLHIYTLNYGSKMCSVPKDHKWSVINQCEMTTTETYADLITQTTC